MLCVCPSSAASAGFAAATDAYMKPSCAVITTTRMSSGMRGSKSARGSGVSASARHTMQPCSSLSSADVAVAVAASSRGCTHVCLRVSRRVRSRQNRLSARVEERHALSQCARARLDCASAM
eukprot:6208399-Pleurochrysis_carterae.AAC.3